MSLRPHRLCRRAWPLALTLAIGGCATQATSSVRRYSASDSAFARMYLEGALSGAEELGVGRLKRGMNVVVPRKELPSVDLRSSRQEASEARSLLDEMARINVNALTEAEFVVLSAVRADLVTIWEESAYWWIDFSRIAPTGTLGELVAALDQYPLDTPAQANQYLFFVESTPSLVDALRATMESRARRGNRLPKSAIDRVAAELAAFEREPASHPLTPDPARYAKLDSLGRRQFREELEEAISVRVRAAATRLRESLSGSYRDSAPDRLGIAQYPEGQAYYRFAVRRATSLDVQPEEVGVRARDAMSRLDAELDRLSRPWRGSLPWREYVTRHRRDSSFATSGEATRALGSAIAKNRERFSALLPWVPTESLTVSLGDIRALTDPWGGRWEETRGRDSAFSYLVAPTTPALRSRLTVEARAAREGLPGRLTNWQAQTRKLSPFVFGLHEWWGRNDGWAAYGGTLWSEHATDSTRARFATALLEFADASLALADVALNFYGWPTERVRDVLRGTALLSDGDIENLLVDMGVFRPGRGTAPFIGHREIIGLRQLAHRDLDTLFTFPRFHEELNRYGEVPLAVLGKHIEWWIYDERRKATEDSLAKATPPAPAKKKPSQS